MKSATESAVTATILPKQKKEKRRQYTLRFREGTSANKSAVLETISPQQKRKTTVIHAKNSDKVRAQTKVQFKRPFHPSKKGRRR